MKISFLGGTEEVGRSAVLVEDEKRRTLLDYGIKVDTEPGLPLPVQGFIDEVIITHAHLDHSGAVPKLYKVSETDTYVTPPTVPLIELLVKDSIKIREMEGLKKIFTKQHLKRMMRNIKKKRYSEETELDKGFKFRFENAGHILGASTIRLETPTANIVYTGDFKTSETQLHEPAYSDYQDTDILITESTYGNEEHPPREKIEKQFYESVQETVDNGGIALIPAFAVGRTQEVITVLEKHGFDGKIYMDGMSKDAADIMLNYPEYINNYDRFYDAMKRTEWIRRHEERNEAMEEPCAIVTTAGMLGGGPVIHYLTNLKDIPGDHGIYLTGYQPEDTPGKEMLESGRFEHEEYSLDFSDYEIEYYDFSAHCDKHALREFAEKIDPEVIFIVHGDEENAKALETWLKENLDSKVFVPSLNDSYKMEKYL